MNSTLFSAGGDPEMCLFDNKQGSIVSAIPVLKRSKDNRIDLKDGYAFYYDNANLEGNLPPASSRNEFVGNYQKLFTKIQRHLGERYSLACVSSHTYTAKEVEHPDAAMAGCSPEFDAYEMAVCYPPDFTAGGLGFRSCGAHIHVGRKDFKQHLDNADGVPLMDPYNKADVIKLMDIFVGIPITIVDKDPTSPARKTLYGKGGRHRPCPYGVEYRVLGNYWLRSPKLVELVYDLTAFVVDLNGKGETESLLEKFNAEEVQNIINNNEIDNGWKFVENLDMPSDLKARIKEANNFESQDFNAEWHVGK